MPGGSVRAAAAAVSFLTRVPVGRAVELGGADVARGVLLFPLVGAAVGACAGGVGILLDDALPTLAVAGVVLAVALLLTGGMHLDALADTLDAAGASTRERALEIMRDPRVGTFGAAAIALDLLVKAAAVAALLDEGGALPALLVAGALSRTASPPLALVLPYPRAGGGPGSVLTGCVSWLAAVGAIGLALGAATIAMGVTGLAMAAAVAVSTALLGLVYLRWLGGATGDCLGAATELGETAALVVAAALV